MVIYRIIIRITVIFATILLCACGKNEGEFILVGAGMESSEESGYQSAKEILELSEKESTKEASELSGKEAVKGASDTSENKSTKEVTELSGKETTEKNNQAEQNFTDKVYVYVCGAVNLPGVVCLRSGSRYEEAIQLAGGFREDADINFLNLAAVAEDGEKLYVPTAEEVKEAQFNYLEIYGQESSKKTTANEASSQTVEFNNAGARALININTASVEELCTLSGIGESRAKDIITYREKNGKFLKKQDIMKVSGIKESIYEKIKDSIKVE